MDDIGVAKTRLFFQRFQLTNTVFLLFFLCRKKHIVAEMFASYVFALREKTIWVTCDDLKPHQANIDM